MNSLLGTDPHISLLKVNPLNTDLTMQKLFLALTVSIITGCHCNRESTGCALAPRWILWLGAYGDPVIFLKADLHGTIFTYDYRTGFLEHALLASWKKLYTISMI